MVFVFQECLVLLDGAMTWLKGAVARCDRNAAGKRRYTYVSAIAMALAFGLMVSGVAFAQTATPSNTVDFAPLVNALIGLIAALIAAAIPLIIARFRANGIIKDDKMASALQSATLAAAQFGINQVQRTLAGKAVPIDMHNQVIAAAATYLNQQVPAVLAHSGKSDADIAGMILARLDLSGGTVTLTGQPALTPAPAPAA
jgi:hypothetical protein